MALKGNVPEQAMLNFRQALALNPYLWEAFEGLCATGKSKTFLFFSFLISFQALRSILTKYFLQDLLL